MNVGPSKQGGLPDLPEDIEWPPKLQFLCQINLDEIKKYDWHDYLPGSGMIWVFISDDALEGQVFYRTSSEGLSQRPKPEFLKTINNATFKEKAWDYSSAYYLVREENEYDGLVELSQDLYDRIDKVSPYLEHVRDQSDRLFGEPTDFMGSGIDWEVYGQDLNTIDNPVQLLQLSYYDGFIYVACSRAALKLGRLDSSDFVFAGAGS
ncbi:DUF1963 domain-containing protein [Flagellimonas sp. S3867]|uniref:DUF1963 domain-containing protein n=1 Tax=Flagellimonas sp. S3867 TaxID=2768063 RepID=UPI0016870894|nr:DUF1963 domain-containing protein [Flagellimonas sp. S3867]